MRRIVMVIVLAACGDSVQDQLSKAKTGGPESTKAICALATAHLENDDAQRLVLERFRDLRDDTDANQGWKKDQLDCLAAGMAAAKVVPRGEELAHAKLVVDAPGVKKLFEAQPADQRKRALYELLHVLESIDYIAKQQGTQLAPLLIVELEKLGETTASDKFLDALAMTASRYGLAESKAKLGKADPTQQAAAWRRQLHALADGVSEGLDRGVATTMQELTARGVALEDSELAALLKACAYGASGGCLAAVKTFPPERLRKALETLGDPYKGKASELVDKAYEPGAGTGDSKVLALLRALEKKAPEESELVKRLSPIGRPDPQLPELATTVTALVALGPSAVQEMQLYMRSDSATMASATAQALARLDEAALASATIQALASYNTQFRGEQSFPQGEGAAAGLRALRESTSKVANDAYLTALSARDPAFVKVAVERIRNQLKAPEATDGLFQFMAAKDEYGVAELDTYEELLVGYGRAASAPIAKNLEAQLAAKRTPEKVFWSLKVVAFRALAKIGDATAVPTLKKYKADKSSFNRISRSADEDDKGSAKVDEVISFSKLAESAIAGASAR